MPYWQNNLSFCSNAQTAFTHAPHSAGYKACLLKNENLKNIMAPIICIIGYTYYESAMTRTSSQY